MCSFELEFTINFSLSLLFCFKRIFGKFLDLIYFRLFIISVNFLDQLVNDLCEPVLKD